MWENFDYNFIMESLLTTVKNKYPDLDYREGSMIWNALSASAFEMAMVFISLDSVMDQSFIETADRTNLYKLSRQMGIDTSVFEAKKGTFRGNFDKPVSLNSIWGIGKYRYIVTKDLGVFEENPPGEDSETSDVGKVYYSYEMECQTPGSLPNNIRGTLTAISQQSNKYVYSELVDVISGGTNEFTDDEIRNYYKLRVNGEQIDGNKMQYEQWCEEFQGIGAYKVFPLWNGVPNTVRISILNEMNRVADASLIEKFQNYLDPGSTGMGDGKAPIGAIVTVVTPETKPINITATFTTKNTKDKFLDIKQRLSDYLAERSFKSKYVSYSQIIAVLLEQPTIENVSNVKINGGLQDITMGENEVPVLGECDFTAVLP